MTELKLAENIIKQRKTRNMTQEELASTLGVTAQAVSNWERGGYPDITLLPAIANYFEITIDELLGNDDISREEDIKKFFHLIREELPGDAIAEKLALCKKYAEKYPKNYDIALELGAAIFFSDQEIRKEYLPLLREQCEKIIAGSTEQSYRDSAIRLMCRLGNDEDFEKWSAMCPEDYTACRRDILELCLVDQRNYDELILRKGANMLERVCYLMTSNPGNWNDPQKAAAESAYLLEPMQSFGENKEIPPAWLGWYGENLLRLAYHLFRSGHDEEGYANLDKAYEIFVEWGKIPNDTALSLGHDWLFHGIKAVKNEWMYQFPDGKKEYSKRMTIFSDKARFMYAAMTSPGRGWDGFDRVREETRFRQILTKAKELADSGENNE
ncbi:MAG: helix-turn-helix transcriptional regulator [Clostridia bacterium]|nr:helix-turn-helix transcriptional regulator [Clostridia bacterium]